MTRTPPLPSPGSALRAFGNGQSVLTGMQGLHQELGDAFRIPLPGFSPVMMVGPEWARYVYVTGAEKLLWRAEHDPVTQLLRHGLLVEDHAQHDELRRHLDPSLHRQMLEGYSEAFVRRTDQVLDTWESGQRRDMLVEMRRIALLSFVETLFGEDFTDHIEELWPSILRVLRFISPGLWIVWPAIPRPGYWQAQQALDEYLYQLITAKRSAPGNDMISQLVGVGLDDQSIRDQALTMLIAGHDTSTSLLAWTLHFLGLHPQTAARVHSELDRVVGLHPPRYDQLDDLEYLGQVIDESLRLYPPIHLSNRVAREDIDFNGFSIRAGTRVMLSIYLTHRDPRFWKNPNQFDPDRFTRDNVASRPPYTYMPFGGGKRNCIGSAFARTEARAVLARIFQRFELMHLDHPIRPHMGATLEPRPGVSMVPKPRSISVAVPRQVEELLA